MNSTQVSGYCYEVGVALHFSFPYNSRPFLDVSEYQVKMIVTKLVEKFGEKEVKIVVTHS